MFPRQAGRLRHGAGRARPSEVGSGAGPARQPIQVLRRSPLVRLLRPALAALRAVRAASGCTPRG